MIGALLVPPACERHPGPGGRCFASGGAGIIVFFVPCVAACCCGADTSRQHRRGGAVRAYGAAMDARAMV